MNSAAQVRISGILLGTAVGDALGLPAEGLSLGRISRLWRGHWRMRLVFGRGMVSDDTEHSVMVAQALLAAPTDCEAFRRKLAWKFRWWFLGLPAGVGMATAKACLKLWLGIPPERSGVWSAGNGPAMRSALIGAVFAGDPCRRREYVVASTKLTHTDPRAEIAALAIAETAASIVNDRADQILASLPQLGDHPEWRVLCGTMAEAHDSNLSVTGFAERLGLTGGITGYAFHTVPMAIYAVLHHPEDYRGAVIAVLDCGGDTDTVGAITGALMGAKVGPDEIPIEWMEGIMEWPRSLRVLKQLACELAAPPGKRKAVHYFWPGIIPRNLMFLSVVLFHGFRRLFPPY